ncbi:hypothetical protein BDQ17DRAFT_1405506 [Cyathus striatus]|nr:hypothetical protein BDQ17DRAFT_1405506 [Cyathus striatus]
MASVNKLTQERSQKTLLELAQKPGNNICADCKVKNPRWASHNLGIFICMHCASIHRKIGTHITKVKSLTMDVWSKDQVEHMKNIGNVKSNAIYNPNEIRHPPPPNLEDSERDGELEQYIRGKYEYRKFIDKSALVASKLGPSRSATSMRSVTMPLAGTSRPMTSSSVSSSMSAPSISPSLATSSRTVTPAPAPAAVLSQPQMPPRPSALANVGSGRSFSQPLSSAPMQQQPQPTSMGGVWDDLVSLQPGARSATLPLQYQQTSISTNYTGLPSSGVAFSSLPSAPLTSGSNVTSGLSMSMSPSFVQRQQFSNSPLVQYQPQSTYATSTTFSGTSSLTPNSSLPQSSFGQQLFMSQMSPQPNTPMGGFAQGQYFQPQPQSASSLQMQVPQNQMGNGYLTPSPQPMMSAPVGQTQFSTTPSPGPQFMSHSPMQHQMSLTPSPQIMMNGMSGQPQQQMMGGGFMGGMPQQQHPGMFMNSAGPQMMASGMMQSQGYSNGYPVQQQHQWGTM